MTAILVPMDGESPSDAALEYALAEFPDADVTVLHVIGVVDSAAAGQRLSGDLREPYDRATARAEDLFESVRRRASEAGRDVATETAYGPPSKTIPGYADGFDRVVMGEHGQAGARQILLGSVAETVVRRAPVPVTVVRERTPETRESRDRRFLVPVDGSQASRRAAAYAIETHDPESLTLLHVVDPADPDAYPEADVGTGRDPPHGSEAWYDRAEAAAESLLDDSRESIDGEGVEIGAEMGIGTPQRVIVERASEGAFDHVVLGSHGRTGLDRLLLGSVAESVVRRSPVTVTVVR